MNPCRKNRKLIAWLVLHELDARAERQIRAHLELCEGCRGYLDELSVLTERLNPAGGETFGPSDEGFHRKVVQALKAERLRGNAAESFLGAAWSRFRWRFALPTVGMAAIVLALILFLRPSSTPSPVRSQPLAAATVHGEDAVEPTISNYQMVANRSFDKLDELLTEQAGKNLPPTQIYRASSLSE